MELRVDRDITGEVFRPTLLAAWPAMGSVGVGAIDYLRRTLEAEPFAEVDAGEFFTPEAVVVEEGLART
ncbi:MAG: PAC2 family protein, partial [Candidatus Latescibacteria bacterium]|nr:PAC2 family protein [Candidatus Latescibacterota bacterium]